MLLSAVETPQAVNAQRSHDDAARWQQNADLLAEGRDLVERLCTSTRFRYLYPEGPALSLLLSAYQEFDRLRLVGRIRGGPWRQRRAFRRMVRKHVRADIGSRSRRLSYGFPQPRLRRLPDPPPLVHQAIAQVDADARELLTAHIGAESARMGMTITHDAIAVAAGAATRGVEQFRDALLNAALANPDAIGSLHPQHLHMLATAAPTVRRHPIATLLFVKLPLQLLLTTVALLVLVYFGAFVFFNDERLGGFVSKNVSGLLEGDLDMRSIHWEPRLIFDLVTGTPSPVVVEDITVWSPYKNTDHGPQHRAAHAERLEASLVLSEIIPWHRLGLPVFLDIPWILHFTEVRGTRAAWFDVREYEDTLFDGTAVTYLSLVDAFRPLESHPERQGLSFAVDDAHLFNTAIDVNYEQTSEWRATAFLDDASFSLTFSAPDPEIDAPIELPFAFTVKGHGTAGSVRIDDIDVPLGELVLHELSSGGGEVPAGDVGYNLDATALGSVVEIRGRLQDVFARLHSEGPEPPPRVDLNADAPKADGLIAHVVAELGLEANVLVPNGSDLTATVRGQLADPIYTLDVDRLSLDLMEEAAWVADDVEVSLMMATQGVPALWADRFDPGETRQVVSFDVFTGVALDGNFTLATRAADDPRFEDDISRRAHIVMPLFEEDSYLISMPLEVMGFNPAQLVPTDPQLQRTLSGVGSGGVDLLGMALGPDPAATHLAEAPTTLERLDVELSELRIRRDNGPATDGLPRDLTFEGTLGLDAEDRLDVGNIVVTSPGTTLRADGGFDVDSLRLSDLLLELRIDDGRAFARSFAIPSYFDKLRARAVARGPMGSPSASGGALFVGGLIEPGTSTDATFVMDDGTLRLRVETSDARLFGGRGRVSADIDVFDRGTLSSNPKISATGNLRGVDLAQLSNDLLEGRADVDLFVGAPPEDSTLDRDACREVSTSDPSRTKRRPNAAALQTLHAYGRARAPAVRFRGTTYRNAVVAFDYDLGTNEVTLGCLVLPLHRAVSPHFSDDLTLPVGEVEIAGTIALGDYTGLPVDPTLALSVAAHRVPLALVTRLLDIDPGIYGSVAETALEVRGTVSRPRVDGTLQLDGLSASGVALGAGELEISSEDYESAGPLAGHRELRVHGELHQGDGRIPIQWIIDAVVAIGEPQGEQSPPIEAQLDIEFDRVAFATLLRDPVDPTRSPPIEGQMEELSAHVLTCAQGEAMLSDCIGVTPPEDQDMSLAVSLAVQSAWMRSATDRLPPGVSPCDSATTLCTGGPLSAEVDWPMIRLADPWQLRTGGDDGASVSIEGTFDLSDPPVVAAEQVAAGVCVPPPLGLVSSGPQNRKGRGDAHIEGVLDLEPIAAVARTFGVEQTSGRLELAVDVDGHALAPRIAGRAELYRDDEGTRQPMELAVEGIPFDASFGDLRLQIVDGWLLADGEVELRGGKVRFGDVDGDHSGYALSGPCAGHFHAAAQGRLSSNLVADVVGPPIVGGPGGVDLRGLHVGGLIGDDVTLNELRGTLAFDQNNMRIEFSEGITSAAFDRGRIDFSRCGTDCPAGDEDWFRVEFGGAPTEGSLGVPPDAIRMTAGTRGRAQAWGTAYIDPAFEHSAAVDLHIRLDDLPYRSYDSSGRPEYEVEVTTRDIAISGGSPLVVTGNAEIDRARYVKDAIQGVEILRFTDTSPEIEEPPPTLLQGMTFDLRVETDRPFRMENNVASGLQADAVVAVSGTYESPEFTGRIAIEPGGTVDIPFLTGTYEIQRGRVTLVRDLEDAEVDVLALRNEPIYIDDQPRSVQLQLGGNLSAIRWSCLTDAGGGELDSVRACTEYLVLGTGDVQLSENDVQQFGAGGLAGVRKPLQVVGHLTEFDVGERAGEAAPKLDPYIPDVRLRLGQIGPELEIATPTEWLDFGWARATLGWDYTRGYPGFLLRQSREFSVKLELLDPVTIQYSRRTRSYLNERIIFDPLEQRAIELRLNFEIPTPR